MSIQKKTALPRQLVACCQKLSVTTQFYSSIKNTFLIGANSFLKRGLYLSLLLLLQLIFSQNSGAQTVLVNYDFGSSNAGCSSTPATASGVTSTFNSSLACDGTRSGVSVSTPTSFATNSTAGNSIALKSPTGGGFLGDYFQFQLGGSSLSIYGSYRVFYNYYVDNSIGTLLFQYSTDGAAWTTFSTITTVTNTWTSRTENLSSITGLNLASSLYFRITIPSNSGGANKYIDIDNFQVYSGCLPPKLNALPSSLTQCQGTAAAMSVTVTSGVGPFTYQWKKNGTAIPGATGATYNISSLATADAGNYTVDVTNSCVTTSSTTLALSVNSLPTITGTLSVCAGSTTQLTGSGTAATLNPWVSANTGVATVNGTGLVTGVSAGAGIITYTNNNGCSITTSVTVNALPTITGTLSICIGSTTQLTGSGTAAASNPWVSANTGVATVSATGLVTSVSAGTSVITYTNNNGCSITATVTVNASPTITGTLSVCAGSTTQLTGTGTPAASNPWVSASTGVATVSSTGLVTGVSAGNSVITYTNNNGCSKTATITVNAIPTITVSASAASLCFSGGGQSSTLSYSATTNSPTAYYIFWNSTASAAGLVNVGNVPLPATPINVSVAAGVSAGTYTGALIVSNANGCISGGKAFTLTINALPTLTGASSVCVGNNTTLSPITAGTWLSSNSAVATITNSGVVTGVSAGSVTFTYTQTSTGCSKTTSPVTVNTSPTVNALTGSNTVCAGSTTTFSSTTTGGSYSSSNTGVATVNSSTGVITAVSAGTANISYAVTNSNGCTTAVTRTVTVNALPGDKTPVTVLSAVCFGSSTNIQITASESGVNYQLRDNATNTVIGSAVAGTGGTINLPTGILTSAVTYNVLATNVSTTCSIQLSGSVTITINPTGTWIGGASGDWNVASNWCGGIPTTTTDVIIPANSTVNIQTANAVANSVTISTNGSLVMTGAYNLTISSGGSFINNGTFTAAGSTGAVVFAGNGTVSGAITFKNIDTYGALDFGASGTVSGTFTLQSGGSVTGHSPSYTCPSATLLYNTSGTFLRGLEWTSSSSGAGCPSNVTIQNNTVINFPVAGQGYVCNDLQIENGSSLRQDYAGGSASLRVGRNIIINGNLSLGSASGGDVYVGGSWTRNSSGVFTHNDRMVIFDGPSNFSGNGTSTSSIVAPASSAKDNEGGFGGENFAHIWINKTNSTDSVVLLSNITVNREIGFTKGIFSLRNNDVTIVSNDTRTADVAPVTNTTNASIRYGGTGRFVIQRFIHNPTSVRSWRLLTAPLESSSAPSINEAYQEGVVNPDKNNPNGSGGIYNPWPGYGIHITGPGGTYSDANGYDQGTNSASILYGNSGFTSWLAPASTKATKVTDQQGWMLFVRGDRGFVIGDQYVPSQNAILEPKGKINMGNVVSPVVAGKQVIGNPYASAISLMEVDVAGTAGKNSTYYMWDPKMYTSYTQPGKWVTFTGVGNGFVQTTSESAYTADGKIESGQAFVIEAPATGNITFHESDKLPLNSSLVGITSGMAARPTNSPITMFRSDMYVKSGTKYTLTDAVLNIFDVSFNNSVNGEDAKKMLTFNTKESFSIFRDSAKLAIEKRNALIDNDTIFFALSKMNELPYQFRFTATNFINSVNAYLEDKYLNTQTALNTSGATVYDFDITPDPLSKAEDRFKIVFKPNFGGVLPVTFTDVKAFAKNEDIAVEWNVENELNIKNYEVQKSIDAANFETVNTITSKGNYSGSRTYSWIDKNPVAGVNYYRVRGTGNSGRIQISPVAKVNMANVKATVAVCPNPVTDGSLKLQLSNMGKGKYYVRLINEAGQLIFSSQFDHAGGSIVKTVAADQKLAKGIYHLELNSTRNEKIMLKVIVE